MLAAGLWGGLGALSLLLGAGLGLALPIPRRTIGLVMGFGAGVLIGALAFELTAEAFAAGGADAVAAGLAVGALASPKELHGQASRRLAFGAARSRPPRACGTRDTARPGSSESGAPW